MKCDVCDTKIPIGGHQCPNCGYKMPVKKVSTFNATSVSHEHIESHTNKPKYNIPTSRMNNEMQQRLEKLKKNPKIGFDFFNFESIPDFGKIAKIIIGVVVCLFVMSFGVINVVNQFNSNEYAGLTFEEVIDAGYDDGSAQAALDFKNEMNKQFNLLGLENISTDEYCDEADGFVAHTVVYGYDDDVSYQVSGSFRKGQQSSKNLFIAGDSKTSLLDEFQGNREVISKLGKTLGSEKLVEAIDESRMYLVEDDNSDEGVLVARGLTPYIYITQNPKDSNGLYYFTIMYDSYGY
ncbi:MAG: hypothetical protein RR585_04665 [Coprobacillus sp.]